MQLLEVQIEVAEGMDAESFRAHLEQAICHALSLRHTIMRRGTRAR